MPALPVHTDAARPASYCPVPQRLITDIYDSPLAIGLYALIGRLYLVAKAPVPLSAADLLRYDPSLSRGAALRALGRLLAGGWLLAEARAGAKTRYTPTWGAVRGELVAWQVGSPCLGRPRHVARLCVDRGLLDVCMGKLSPHPSLPAPITRYLTAPALGLADVGCYALTLAGQPRETPALHRLGAVRAGEARPLPPDAQLLAIISQRALVPGDAPELTASGARKLGLAASAPTDAGAAQPLFFVPAGTLGVQLGARVPDDRPATAEPGSVAACPSSAVVGDTADRRLSTANQPETTVHPRALVRARPAVEVPDTAAARLLATINVHPRQQAELASLAADLVEAAIADARARADVRDLAGWVVALLRARRDHGWQPGPPAPRADSPEALGLAFARLAAAQEAAQREQPDQEALLEAQPPELAQIWRAAQEALRLRLTRAEHAAWLRPCALAGIGRGVATIVAPSAGVKQALERRLIGQLRDALAHELGSAIAVRVILAGAAPAPDSPPERPAWIDAERWRELPALVRAALAGAVLTEAGVQARSAFLTQQLRARHPELMERLAARDYPAPVALESDPITHEATKPRRF